MGKRTDVEKILPILMPVLGEDLARAIIEHRDDVKGMALTETAAKLQVKEYLKCGDPVAAAEMQILRGWRAIKSSWYFSELEKDARRPQQTQRRSAMDAARDLIGNSHHDNGLRTIQH